MSRQEVEFKVVGADKDSGEEDVTAIKPVADGQPGNAANFTRPSENLRTRTEFIRDELENLKFLSDADRALLLTSSGSVTWNGLPTGTFTASADLTLKPFTAPNVSTASRLIIGATTASQITIRTRQNGTAGQPRAYSGANAISFDFTPVTTGTGVVIITVDGTPANNFHVQYDDDVVSGTTVLQMLNYLNNVTPTAGGAAFVAAGLEAVVDNTLGPNGGPLEVGFPTPPAPVVGNKIVCSGPEQALRFMAGAADAEKHNITPAHLTTFFADPLNVMVEGDVLCLRYDDLVMALDGGRRQSIDEFPEDKADSAGLNLFLMRRFPARLPGALPVAAVVNGILIFVNNRSYISGEVGPLVAAGASYQGSPAAPNSWADGTTVTGPISFETALDTVIQTLGTKAGVTPGAIKIGFTPSGNIAANTVKGALEELDSEKAGLALANTFTANNTIANAVADTAALTTTNVAGFGPGLDATGGSTDGPGVKGTGGGSNGNGGYFQTSASASAGVAAVYGKANSTNSSGVIGDGNGTGVGVGGRALGTGAGVSGQVPGATLASGIPAGVLGFGGATAPGVLGRGGGTGPAVRGDGAVAGALGVGVEGQGGGTQAGVAGTGGATDGTGVLGVGGGTNGYGVEGQGQGSGVGLRGVALGSAAGIEGFGGGATGTGVIGNGSTNGPGVAGFGAGSGTGVVGSGGATGYGVSASADTTTPVRAALRLVPQDTDPSSPLQGDLYVNSGDGTLRIYNGAAWVKVGTQT